MQLKLADYGENKEKFERFLYLGEDFLFGGECIVIAGLNLDRLREDPKYYGLDTDLTNISIHPLDEKDPLNRFDGLFSGRTFGEGRFVLIHTREGYYNQDDVISSPYWKGAPAEISHYVVQLIENYLPETGKYDTLLGNLHENPELIIGNK